MKKELKKSNIEAGDGEHLKTFYERAKEKMNRLKPRTFFCKGKDRNLFGNNDGIRKRLRSSFKELLDSKIKTID